MYISASRLIETREKRNIYILETSIKLNLIEFSKTFFSYFINFVPGSFDDSIPIQTVKTGRNKGRSAWAVRLYYSSIVTNCRPRVPLTNRRILLSAKPLINACLFRGPVLGNNSLLKCGLAINRRR